MSHDRRFLDDIVTQPLVAEGNSVWREYVGGYSDWLKQRPRPVVGSRPAKRATATDNKPRTRLGYKEQRELAALPGEIEALEREQAELTARMSSADYYRQGAQQIRDDRKRAEETETLLLEKFARWQALEAIKDR